MRKIIIKTFVLPILVFTLAFYAVVAQSSFLKASAIGEERKTLYYFSDDSHCFNYANRLFSEGIVDVYELYNWSDRDRYTDFEDAYTQNYYDIDWDDMIDAYVIFEMNTGFRGNADRLLGEPIFPETLENLFRILKRQGCHIMFICGTEESMFENCNDFLAYVDIHVNTDLTNLFLMNVFMYAFDIASPLENVTFVLDESFGGLELIDNNWFFTEWLQPYLVCTYLEDMYILDVTWQWICESHGIKIVLCRQDGSYRDAFYPQNVLYNPVYDGDYENFIDYINNPYICAIGTSRKGATALSGFIDDIDLLAEIMQRGDIPLFVYNKDCYSLPTYNGGTTYQVRACTNYYSIIVDFLSDADLNVYDNWDGNCEITHKAIVFGEGGWLRCPYGLFSWKQIYNIRRDLPQVPYV